MRLKISVLAVLTAVLSVLTFSGCVPVVIVAGAAATAGGAIAYDQRGLKTMMADQKSESTAQLVLDHDPQIKGRAHIRVSVYNRIALLVGQAPSTDLSNHANQLVSGIQNIDKVYNQIIIEGSISMLEDSNDGWLVSKVKTGLVAQKGLHSSQIRVVVEDGVVYLMGLVTQQQGDMAANVARHVAGVRQVVKVFQYT